MQKGNLKTSTAENCQPGRLHPAHLAPETIADEDERKNNNNFKWNNVGNLFRERKIIVVLQETKCTALLTLLFAVMSFIHY